MIFSEKFIRRNARYSTFYDHVPAPMFRREFSAVKPISSCSVTITGVGFYDLYFNGKHMTKGYLAPYISAPSELVYYDTYDLTESVKDGTNCIGVIVGTALQNDVGRYNWRFDCAKFRGPVRFASAIEIVYTDGSQEVIECDESWRCTDSPIIFDSLYIGEHYDARREIPGWNLPGFDDSAWDAAEPAETPLGEAALCSADPIRIRRDLYPVSIMREERGYIYDFGENCAGITTLCIRNTYPGQTVKMTFGEIVRNGVFDDDNISIMDRKHIPSEDLHFTDVYICRGADEEIWTPTFTYHGFQYVLVEGITEDQAVPSLLTYHVMHSDVKPLTKLSCSDDSVCRLQDMVLRTDLANLYYFPTDCPHREKNGWTGDAALSAEQMIMNFGLDATLHEWMKNIRKSQHEDGSLSGYVPTPGWYLNYGGPPGPGWDKIITDIPYLLYHYRGDTKILSDNANMIGRYLNYLAGTRNADGLYDFGFGDWVQAGIIESGVPVDCPASVSNTASAIEIVQKASEIFEILQMPERKVFADALLSSLRTAFAQHLIDYKTCTVAGNCQTSQAMGLYLGFFLGEDEARAVKQLVRFVHEKDDHLSVGVLGGRLIFRVLADYGYADLAYKMIVRRDPPSYGHYVEIGATTLWEGFIDENQSLPYSRSHHFWGDISSWFFTYPGGIRLSHSAPEKPVLALKPCFIEALDHIRCEELTPYGVVLSTWERKGDQVIYTASVPNQVEAVLYAPNGYRFHDGKDQLRLYQENVQIIFEKV